MIKRFSIAILIISSCLYASPEEVYCQKAIDGDTIVVESKGQKKVIRLLGIDTPESRENAHLKWQVNHWKIDRDKLLKKGREATVIMKKICRETPQMTVVYDKQKYDHYGRDLAYIFLQDGTFLNEWLLQQNIAHIFILPPNIAYQYSLQKSWKSVSLNE